METAIKWKKWFGREYAKIKVSKITSEYAELFYSQKGDSPCDSVLVGQTYYDENGEKIIGSPIFYYGKHDGMDLALFMRKIT